MSKKSSIELRVFARLLEAARGPSKQADVDDPYVAKQDEVISYGPVKFTVSTYFATRKQKTAIERYDVANSSRRYRHRPP